MTRHGTDRAVIAIDSDGAEGVFAALSSATARDILAALYGEPMTASALGDAVDTSLQNVSHHLDQLAAAGLIEVVGTEVSAQGRDMNRYGPTSDALVLRAGDERPAPRGGDSRSPESRGGGVGARRKPGPVAGETGDGGEDVPRAFLVGVLLTLATVALLRAIRGD